MAEKFEVRFMDYNEIDRVAELIKGLQTYQKMKVCPRIPSGENLREELTHMDPQSGLPVTNKFGTYTIVSIDKTKSDDKSRVVGYLIYSSSFSIIQGHQFWMNSFFIEADYRNAGLGKRMMEFMFEHGRFMGIKRIDIPYMNDNIIGQKFYSKFGSNSVSDEYCLKGIKID